ncbi:MAG: 50S ribosomal protein L29 [Clostridia bacterium]
MKSSKLNDYRKMTVEQLDNEIKLLKKDLFKARFSSATGGLDNPKKMTEIKKNIARANTVKSSLSNLEEVN